MCWSDFGAVGVWRLVKLGEIDASDWLGKVSDLEDLEHYPGHL